MINSLLKYYAPKMGVVFDLTQFNMPIEALSSIAPTKKKGKKAGHLTAKKFVKDKTYNEIMLPSETPSQEILIGIGKNLYHQAPYRFVDHPVTNYKHCTYLKFPITNTDLLNFVYDHFGYNDADESVSKPKKGWVIADECGGYFLPELYFSSINILSTFLKKIGKHVKVREIQSGQLVTQKNRETIIASAVA